MSHRVGEVYLFAAYRCSCGKLCAMGDQPNGNAATVHQWPFCERYEALPPLSDDGIQTNQEYFLSLGEPIEMTRELANELAQTCSPPELQNAVGLLPDPPCPGCGAPLTGMIIGRKREWFCVKCDNPFFDPVQSLGGG